MGTYRITDNVTGKTVTVSGENAPTDADAEKIFSEAGLRGNAPPQVSAADVLSSPKQSLKFAWDTIKNVPSSTASYFGNMLKGIQGIPEMFADTPEHRDPYLASKNFDAAMSNIAGQLKERYGGWDKLLTTIQNDPVGVAGDVSLLYGKADPTRAITGPVKWVAGKVAPRTVQSALKMSTSVPMPTREAITQEALNQPIFKTLEGRHALAKEGIQAIEKRIGDAIAQADAAGITAKASDITSALDDLSNSNTMSKGPLYKQNQAAVQSVRDAFVDNPNNLMPNGEYPLSLAQSMKKATYDDITRAAAGKAYTQTMKGGVKAVTPDVAAMQTQAKTLADQVYSSLEAQYPELRGLGKEEGAKIGLKQSIEAAIPRIANTELINLGMPAGVVMGDMLGGQAGAKAMLGAKLIERIPAVKASLAVALYKASKMAPSRIPSYAYGMGRYMTPEGQNE